MKGTWLYRGKRERPLSQVERRDFTIQILVGTLGLLVTVAGLVVLVHADGKPDMGPVLSGAGALLMLGGGYVGLRQHRTPQLHRLDLSLFGLGAAAVVIALAGYLTAWRRAPAIHAACSSSQANVNVGALADELACDRPRAI
jgi:drug/metabolite transporter (DMT)-like permease